MEEIRAFVGHSFNSEDADLVNKFLKYFEQLAKSQLQFSWEHAQAAEPRELADKVLALLADKNVLIAICTKRERVVEDDALKPTITGAALKANKEAFDWKTSDWIIQEIGLAKGRNLDMILLIENGVRKPGGLQGNVEYINFERESPEKSFGAIVEMLNALTPKVSPTTATTPPERRTDLDQTPDTKEADDAWLKPKPSWGRTEYEIAFVHFVSNKDDAGAKSIDEAYLQSADSSYNDNGTSWEAFKEYLGVKYGKNTDLAKLRELAETNPKSSITLRYLAAGLAQYKDYLHAASAYEAAAKVAPTPTDTLNLLAFAAIAHTRAGSPTSTTSIINSMRTLCQSGIAAEELYVLKALRRIAEVTKNDDLAIVAMEGIVELEAADIDTRFSLAYLHSETGNDDLALEHYLRIPDSQRDAGVWNNLGVAFGRLSMPTKAIESFRKSANDGSTLAMSNLAREFIDAGFLSEAKELCQKAVSISDYSANIDHDLARVKEIPDEESKKLEETLIASAVKAGFYKEIGRAIVRPHLKILPSLWMGPDGPTQISVNGENFLAECEYDVPNGALSLAFGSGNKVRHRRRWEGRVCGGTIFATVTRDQIVPPAAPNALLGIEDKSKVLLILSDDSRELRAIEAPQTKNPRFYSFTSAPTSTPS